MAHVAMVYNGGELHCIFATSSYDLTIDRSKDNSRVSCNCDDGVFVASSMSKLEKVILILRDHSMAQVAMG
jgi:hypothetical protein